MSRILSFTDSQIAALPNPPAPAVLKARLIKYVNDKASSLLAVMQSYDTTPTSGAVLKADATAETIADLLACMQWGAANQTATKNWVANDGSVTAITGAQFEVLAPLVGAYRQSIYSDKLGACLVQINSGEIMSFAQIDEIFAA